MVTVLSSCYAFIQVIETLYYWLNPETTLIGLGGKQFLLGKVSNSNFVNKKDRRQIYMNPPCLTLRVSIKKI